MRNRNSVTNISNSIVKHHQLTKFLKNKNILLHFYIKNPKYHQKAIETIFYTRTNLIHLHIRDHQRHRHFTHHHIEPNSLHKIAS